MPAFVINLKRSADRRRVMEDQFTRLGMSPTFIEAVDGSASVTPPGPLAAGELGCLLSHCAAWERMVRESIPAAAIFEDDCRLDARLPDLLDTIDEHRRQWDLVLLGHHSRRHGPDAGSATCYRGIALDGRYRLSRVAEFAMGAYAYVLSLDGASKLLAYAHPLRMPADWVTGYAPAAGARLWAVTPPCAWPDPQLAARTTMTDRRAGTVTHPGGRAPGVVLRMRSTAGLALLYARRLGFQPGSYVKHVRRP
jgi:glycosyl transferase family 25